MKEEQIKKLIAPIIIAALFLIYLILYVGSLIFASFMTTPLLILLAVPLIALGAGMVYVLISRIREIKKGEDDDLSHY